MSGRCWGKTTGAFRAEGFKSSRNTESSRSTKGTGPGHRKEAGLGHPEGQSREGPSGHQDGGNLEDWAQVSTAERRVTLEGCRGVVANSTENRENTYYFLPLHPSILVPRLNLQLAQTQGLGEIYSGKSGVHPQQGMQPPSHYPLGPAWPRATCPAWRGTSASQSVSLGPSAAAR